jgi:hypothetical protein
MASCTRHISESRRLVTLGMIMPEHVQHAVHRDAHQFLGDGRVVGGLPADASSKPM